LCKVWQGQKGSQPAQARDSDQLSQYRHLKFSVVAPCRKESVWFEHDHEPPFLIVSFNDYFPGGLPDSLCRRRRARFWEMGEGHFSLRADGSHQSTTEGGVAVHRFLNHLSLENIA